jgi:glycine C-acetyltransferase
MKNTELFRARMEEAGFDLGQSKDHPIVPVMLYDARVATLVSDKMLERGIYVIGFSFPVVPRDKARIRVQLSAAHSTADVNKCVDAFIAVRDEIAAASN